ncbi:VOC family protein [Fructobacillus sp. W13]|uniref:VOC family protein n=1 Tax=Fructobacillus apis TaxID=2935017 RepID=A0ABT0ZQJ6_9LACO|nr:VOC family protein [Fructobacillus apis]MCO0832263.1 VOC family protein [Fructobacillus apis]
MALTDYFDDIQHVGVPTKDLDRAEKFWESIGFKKIGDFAAGPVKFMQYGHLIIETWLSDEGTEKPGAINHVSMNTSDADKAFEEAKKMGLDVMDKEVQHLPFWDHGIKFFNVRTPDGMTLEFCEKVQK